MAVPRGSVDSATRVEQDYHIPASAPSEPYFVFTVEAGPEREAWFEIPELRELCGQLQRDVRGGNVAAATESFTVFKRVTLTSYDLLPPYAERLVRRAG